MSNAELRKGVGETRKGFPVEETSERSERQKPMVSEERERAHLVERARREAIAQARRGWAEKSDIANARPLQEFRRALKS